MKTNLTLLMLGSAIYFIACGPSAKEKATKEKARQDSIHTADSLKAVIETVHQKQVQDSLAVIEQARQDSVAKAQALVDSKAKIKVGKKTHKS